MSAKETDGLKEGRNKPFGRFDPDDFREYMLEREHLVKREKLTTLAAAIREHVRDGDYVKLGGFGQVRVPMAAIFEVVRQRRRDLTVAGHTTSHDLDVLLASGCVSRVEVAYSFAHELRPVRSAVGPRLIKSGKLTISEWSNASFSWRLKAAAMGLSFIPMRSLLGTDTFLYSGAKEIRCPFTGVTYAALPALYPDVALLHVNRADRFGNAEIEGMVVADDDAARASRKVVITTEELVEEEYFLGAHGRRTIPYFYVDAVVHVPFGSYPCEMPGRYWFDEHHISEYLNATFDEAELERYLQTYFHEVDGWEQHLARCAGPEKLHYLGQIANHEVPPPMYGDVWKDVGP